MAAHTGRRADWDRSGCEASSAVRNVQKTDGDAGYRHRQGGRHGINRNRGGWLHVRRGDTACIRLVRRRRNDHRERGVTEAAYFVENLKTERGARTIALDPKTHRIFLPTAQL